MPPWHGLRSSIPRGLPLCLKLMLKAREPQSRAGMVGAMR